MDKNASAVDVCSYDLALPPELRSEYTRERLRQYMEAIRPFQNIRHHIFSMTVPKMTIYPDGKIEHEYDFTDQQKADLKIAQEGIEAIQRAMGLLPDKL